MSKTIKTPGVYIQEQDAFGNAFVPVPTAVPAFIGHTKKNNLNGQSLLNKVVKISSLAQFFTIFGSDPPLVQFSISDPIPLKNVSPVPTHDFSFNEEGYLVKPSTTMYRLYSAMKFFYANGGGECYVMCIGDYNKPLDKDKFIEAIDLLKKEQEPTILVIPDAIEIINTGLSDNDKKDFSKLYANAYSLQSKMINHCGDDMPSRVAILDIPGGFSEPMEHTTQSVDVFRDNVTPINPKSNSYAAAYYPWLHTSIYSESEISYRNLDSNALISLNTMLRIEFAKAIADDVSAIKPKEPMGELNVKISYLIGKDYVGNYASMPKKFSQITPLKKQENEQVKADAEMKVLSNSYKMIINTIKQQLNLMAPSAAMAGIYTAVDNSEGVWKAPANVAVGSVIAPAINIDNDAQQELNVPLSGKSICAIRAFKGLGVLVWGARTLDGNSNDWRYINVRRTLIFIEQSVKNAAQTYVFAPNDASTWRNVVSMIANFLTGLWNQGGLVGPKPADAFSVSVGLGTTMTNEDIQQGIMRISVKVAVSHPAEFIEINFQQQMQKV